VLLDEHRFESLSNINPWISVMEIAFMFPLRYELPTPVHIAYPLTAKWDLGTVSHSFLTSDTPQECSERRLKALKGNTTSKISDRKFVLQAGNGVFPDSCSYKLLYYCGL
jgi:hypothetical protein